MKNATRDNTKKERRPRPPETGTLVGVRLQPDELGRLDAHIAKQPDEPSRPEAIRRVLDGALPAQKVKALKVAVKSEITKLLKPKPKQ